MRWEKGDIWIWHKLGHCIVIPTNAGWKKDGTNVMGRGLARDAAMKFPELPALYGSYCQGKIPHVYFAEYKLILVPTKPLLEKQPYASWKQDADIKTVEGSLNWLQNYVVTSDIFKEIYVPVIGTGNGKLPAGGVQALMDKILTSTKLIGITNT